MASSSSNCVHLSSPLYELAISRIQEGTEGEMDAQLALVVVECFLERASAAVLSIPFYTLFDNQFPRFFT
jgi:hypothetical protein